MSISSHRSLVLGCALASPSLACSEGNGRETTIFATTLGEGSSATSPSSGESGMSGMSEGDETGPGETDDPDTSEETGEGIDCEEHPELPECDCDALLDSGEHQLGPCDPACRDTVWRYALWVTNYNVAGTLGYGEHQGLGLIGVRYSYDPRFDVGDGIEAPWRPGGSPWMLGDAVSEAQQFWARITAPGGESYVEDVELPGDSDDLFAGETSPLVPVLEPHPQLDAAALCEEPELVLDRRLFNHGRTLAERVPNHEWDSFFARRDLIPLEQLAAIELAEAHDGVLEGPGSAEQVDACLAVIDDGFCDLRCQNCSYVLPVGFGLPLWDAPANQIAGIPQGTVGPYQLGANNQLVNARENYSRFEDQRIVWYVGGSSWGRAVEVLDYGPGDWPDPDLTTVDASAFMSVVGDLGPGGIPGEYDDAFTHCVDPNAFNPSQSPILTSSLISGRWGHNSNSDAEAALTHFLDCAIDPLGAADPLAWNESACVVCGEPRLLDGAPTQAPCQDETHTATSYWDMAPGAHDVDDLELGRYTAVGPERTQATWMSQVPDPICGFSGQPVYGM